MHREISTSPAGAHATALIEKFRARNALVAVIGMGYVGLPLAVRMAEAGFRTLGLDIDAEKVAKLGAGQTYLKTVPAQSIAGALAKGFAATTDFARVREADAIVICVPTPLDARAQPDLSFVIGTVESLLPHLRAGQLVSLESTTYPGTTEEELRPRIESRGFRIGRGFLPRVLARARGSGQRALQHAHHPEDLRRFHAGLPCGGAGAVRRGDRHGGAGEFHARGGDGQAAGEHPPRGEHRPGQRDEDRRRPHGHRHPRGDPRGRDQAFRLRAVLSRARAWAGTASRSTRSTSPGRRASTAWTRASSSSRAK